MCSVLLLLCLVLCLPNSVWGWQPQHASRCIRPENQWITSGLAATATTPASAPHATPATTTQPRRVCLLLCPAQFCVPADYADFFVGLRAPNNAATPLLDDADTVIGTTVVAPLSRTDWLQVARQLPTRAFWDGQLPVYETLHWYFAAMDQGLATILAHESSSSSLHLDHDFEICIVGHSMGGWVARAYLAGLSGRVRSTAISRVARSKITSLVTLGTPHVSAPTAWVDQTRGLLRAIAADPAGTPEALARAGVRVVCVGSNGINGTFWTTNVEQLVAATSYLPLRGPRRRHDNGSMTGDGGGDGIVPLELSFLEAPAERVIVERCQLSNLPVRHSHVIPTPWNLWDGRAPSWVLPADRYPSYVSPGVVSQWIRYI